MKKTSYQTLTVGFLNKFIKKEAAAAGEQIELTLTDSSESVEAPKKVEKAKTKNAKQ